MMLVGHGWWEFAGVFTAMVAFWGVLVVKMAKAHIDRRIDHRLHDCVVGAVKAEIHNGITSRMNRIEDKLDRLMELHIGWDGEERRQ